MKSQEGIYQGDFHYPSDSSNTSTQSLTGTETSKPDLSNQKDVPGAEPATMKEINATLDTGYFMVSPPTTSSTSTINAKGLSVQGTPSSSIQKVL